MGYTVGTGVATAQKFAQRPTAFLPRPSANWVSRVIPKSKLPHSHVCTDEFTQTGATYYITIFRFSEGSCSSPQKEEAAQVHRRGKPSVSPFLQISDFLKVVARVHRRGKLLKSTEGGSCLNPQKEEAAQVHRRRKLRKSTEGGNCSSPQKEEDAQVHRRRKLLESTEGGSC